MAYYENRNELLGGDLILYQRNLKTAAPNSKNHRQAKWYMKLRIGPHQTINRSTGLTNYEEAYSFARKEFDRLRNAHKLFNFHPIIISPYSRKGIPNYRRPSFDEAEWQALNAYMDTWILGETEHDKREGARLNSSHIYHRKLCRLYVQFLAATGLRTGEALKLKLRDMTPKLDSETGIVHYEIAVSKHNKTGARTAIGGLEIRRIYLQIRRLTGRKEPDDWVFCNKDGKQAKGFYKTLPDMLKQSGLLYDSNGDRRVAYSLRHYYAESTLRKMRYTANAIDLLCKNMGTSRQSIENHYVRRGAISNIQDILQPNDEQKGKGMQFLEHLKKLNLKP